jgi:hypothetical protein
MDSPTARGMINDWEQQQAQFFGKYSFQWLYIVNKIGR